MSVTLEELAAFADGELEEPRRSEVAAAVAADRALEVEVERHRALKDRLSAHFAPILDAPLPERLTAPLAAGEPQVVDFAAAKQRRTARGIPRWSWFAGAALAASLALMVFLPRASSVPEGYAGPQLATALNSQLVASQASNAPTQILLSFRNDGGQYCRAYSNASQSGIACKEEAGWRLLVIAASTRPARGDYKMAGSSAARVMSIAQEMAGGPALSAEEEENAKVKGWR